MILCFGFGWWLFVNLYISQNVDVLSLILSIVVLLFWFLDFASKKTEKLREFWFCCVVIYIYIYIYLRSFVLLHVGHFNDDLLVINIITISCDSSVYEARP